LAVCFWLREGIRLTYWWHTAVMVSFLIALLMVKPLKRSTQKEWQSGAGNNDGACNGVTVMAEMLGQTVPIPPKWTTSEQVTLLLNNASPSCQLLTTRFLIYAEK